MPSLTTLGYYPGIFQAVHRHYQRIFCQFPWELPGHPSAVFGKQLQDTWTDLRWTALPDQVRNVIRLSNHFFIAPRSTWTALIVLRRVFTRPASDNIIGHSSATPPGSSVIIRPPCTLTPLCDDPQKRQYKVIADKLCFRTSRRKFPHPITP